MPNQTRTECGLQSNSYEMEESNFQPIWLYFPNLTLLTNIVTTSKVHMTWSSPRRPLFLHALSFDCTSKLCINFINQFSVYFHI